ncbi:MAG: hypothetical protein E7356_04075 [Clostridiales bacterium]|nr:hypothetical protein [Clostridiales bacterium]
MIILIIVILVFLSGCAGGIEKDMWDNMSEYREVMLQGRSEGVYATLISGLREKDYKMDGVSTEKIPFGVITVDLVRGAIEEYSYNLFIGTEKYEGTFDINPHNNTLIADISKCVDANENVVLDIVGGDSKISVKLKNVNLNWAMDARDCVKILLDKYKTQIKSLYDKNNFNAEVYIKIIDEWDEYGEEFFLYISVVAKDDRSISMLISPHTGDILASNIIGF